MKIKDKNSGKSKVALQKNVKADKAASEKKENKKTLKVRFLGGVGEIGKNMTALEFGKDIIVVDAGLTFPSENMPGVDLVIPDVSYLEQNKTRIRGIVINTDTRTISEVFHT